MQFAGLFWRKVFRLPQTYFLIVGTTLGYLGFIVWLGTRLVAWVAGGAIALAMIVAWIWKLRQMQALAADNLLEREIFSTQLNEIGRKLAGRSASEWEQALKWARETQEFAARIDRREPKFNPELIEALYTVLALANQLADALLALEQVQTDTYRTLAQQHWQASQNRLQQTHYQLQQLQDQVLLANLEASEVKAELPHRLRLLISDNKTALHKPIQDSSPANGG